MSNLSDLKNRLKNINETKKITKAMYLISSVKLNKIKNDLNNSRVFFDKINSTLYDIITRNSDIKSIYLESNEKSTDKTKKAYLIFIADNGLVGGYNYNIIKSVEKNIEDKQNSILMLAGYMGKNILEEDGYNIDQEFDFFVHDPNLQRSSDMTNYIINMYTSKKIDKFYVIYTDMITSLKKEVKVSKILPLDIESIKKQIDSFNKVDDIINDNNNIKKDNDVKYKKIEFVYEPSFEDVLNRIMPIYLKGVLYNMLVEAYASEQNSRIFAMNSATQNADKIIKRLNTQYNRQRQEIITQKLNEIVSNMKK